ncbi:MAG: hypothetical protein AAF628_19625 [Planctomycetota bacterium]
MAKGALSLPAAAAAELDRWWAELRRQPDRLPAGVEPVQTRLVRAVGRGVLPQVGDVHVKAMGFPRGKDRLRYAFRALPAVHEARLLQAVAAAGLRCPAVVTARGARRWGLPACSMLVTGTLPVMPAAAPAWSAMAAVAARLAACGVFHPDLHSGNFLPLRDGATAVLDLQSARQLPAPLERGPRREMAAKLLLERDAAALETLEASGLVDPADRPDVLRRAAALRRAAVVRRILRCLQTSTEFVRERRWNGTLHRRRDARLGPAALDGGGELVRLWLGDRTHHILDGQAPRLDALFRKYPWLPGRHSLYSSADRFILSRHGEHLLEGFERLESLRRGELL